MKKTIGYGALLLLLAGSGLFINSYMEYKSELSAFCREFEGNVQAVTFSSTYDIELVQQFAESISTNSTLGISDVSVLSSDAVMAEFIERNRANEITLNALEKNPDKNTLFNHEVRFTIDDIKNFDETVFASEIVRLSNSLNIAVEGEIAKGIVEFKTTVEWCYNIGYSEYRAYKNMSYSVPNVVT